VGPGLQYVATSSPYSFWPDGECQSYLDALQERLSEILGCRVDLIEEAALSPRMQREINRDCVLAF
jgi:predicted nucleotidyltransferase